MRVCLVAEGCYPYVVGGVSGWINSMITAFPDIEFVILSVISNRSISGKFVYQLPENVSEVYETYLDDVDWYPSKKNNKLRLSAKEYKALRSIVFNVETDWGTLFQFFQKKKVSLNDLVMGEDFLNIVTECYDEKYQSIVFSDFLWTMRSIYLPLFFVLQTNIPKADVYHCVATGYSGVLGSMAKHKYNCGLIVSEHGIYTREREEELLKATWVKGIYKNIWIEQFKKMSQLAYDYSDVVTCLFDRARELQVGLGCEREKIQVTPNGIVAENLANIPGKQPEDEAVVNIGAVLRVTPIKDVKTMIRAFSFARMSCSQLRLWIMGPCDEDEEYATECRELVSALELEESVIFTGRVNVREYLGRMDLTILTSISEGMPLTILESYAAHKPVIATDVGNCRELIYGKEGDTYGEAGILTHIMNTAEIADAMVTMAQSEEKRKAMGECGYRRLMAFYQLKQMQDTYRAIYHRFEK